MNASIMQGAFTMQHFDQDLNFLATEEDPVTKKVCLCNQSLFAILCLGYLYSLFILILFAGCEKVNFEYQTQGYWFFHYKFPWRGSENASQFQGSSG